MAVKYPVFLTGGGKTMSFYTDAYSGGELNLLRLSQAGADERAALLAKLTENLDKQMKEQQTIERELRGVLQRMGGYTLEDVFNDRTIDTSDSDGKKTHTFGRKLGEKMARYAKGTEEQRARYQRYFDRIKSVNANYYRTLSTTFDLLAEASAACEGKDPQRIKAVMEKLTKAGDEIDKKQQEILKQIENAVEVQKFSAELDSELLKLHEALTQDIKIKFTAEKNPNGEGISISVQSNKKQAALKELEKAIQVLAENAGVKNTSKSGKKGESPYETLLEAVKYMTNLSKNSEPIKKKMRAAYESLATAMASLEQGSKVQKKDIFSPKAAKKTDKTTQRSARLGRKDANDIVDQIVKQAQMQINNGNWSGGEWVFERKGDGQFQARGNISEIVHARMDSLEAKLMNELQGQAQTLVVQAFSTGSRRLRVQIPLVGYYEVEIDENDVPEIKSFIRGNVAKAQDYELKKMLSDSKAIDDLYVKARKKYNDLKQIREVQDKVDNVLTLQDTNNGEIYNIAYSEKFYNAGDGPHNFTKLAMINHSNMLNSLDLFTGAAGLDSSVTDQLIIMMVNLSSASVLSNATQREALKDTVQDMVSTYILQEAFNASNFENFFQTQVLQDTSNSSNTKTLYVMNANNTYASAWRIMYGVLEQLKHRDIMEQVVSAELTFDTSHTGYGLFLESLAAVPVEPGTDGSMDTDARKDERWNYVSAQVLQQTSINVSLNIAALGQLFAFN